LKKKKKIYDDEDPNIKKYFCETIEEEEFKDGTFNVEGHNIIKENYGLNSEFKNLSGFEIFSKNF
jgi:hypothetical protein